MRQIDKIRSEMAIQKMEVSNLLGWTDMQYAEFQEEMGIEYIKTELTPKNPPVSPLGRGESHRNEEVPSLAMELVKFKEFWSWWRLQWMRRDEEFLEMSTSLFPTEYEEYYRELHQPDSMLFRPHTDVMRSTYNQMVHRLVKNTLRQATKSRKEVVL